MSKYLGNITLAIAACVGFAMIGTAIAFGQVVPVGPPVDVTISAKPLIEQIQPYIVSAVGAVITAVALFAVSIINKAGKKYGFEIDAAARDSVISSAKNAAGGLIAKGAVIIENSGKITLPDGLLAQAAKEIIEKRAPDAVAQLSMKPADVEKRIVEQIGQITAPTADASTLTKTA